MKRKIVASFDSWADRPSVLTMDWREQYRFVLDFSVKVIPKIVSAERCRIFFHDPTTANRWFEAGSNSEQEDDDAAIDSDSVIGEVIATGKPIIVNDPDQIEGILERLPSETDFVIRDFLCLPICSFNGKDAIGAILLLNRMYGNKFSENDLELMEEVAIAIEQSLGGIYYQSQTNILLRRATLITRIAITLGVILIVGLTVAYALWVISTHM